MRIVVMTYETLYSNYITQRLLEERGQEVVGLVSSTCLVYRRSFLGSLLYLLRRGSGEFLLRKGMETLAYRALLLWLRLRGKKPRVLSLKEMASRYSIPLLHSEDVNSPRAVAWIKALNPELLVSIYLNQWIGPELIEMPARGCINIHPALLPRYRGLFPYFWVLANGEEETGVTVHYVDRKFDTGPIIVQERVPILPQDTAQSLSYRCAQVGANLLLKAVKRVEEGFAGKVQDEAQASYFSWPTSADFRRLRARGRKWGSWRELLDYL